MDVPLTALEDEDACDARPVGVFHPGGLARPRCVGDRLGEHHRHCEPLLDDRCRDCRCVFNATALHKTSRPPRPRS